MGAWEEGGCKALQSSSSLCQERKRGPPLPLPALHRIERGRVHTSFLHPSFEALSLHLLYEILPFLRIRVSPTNLFPKWQSPGRGQRYQVLSPGSILVLTLYICTSQKARIATEIIFMPAPFWGLQTQQKTETTVTLWAPSFSPLLSRKWSRVSPHRDFLIAFENG